MGGNQSNRAEVMGYKDGYVEFEDQLYAEGTFRRVYRGRFHGDVVVKVYKEPYSLDLEEYAWKADDRVFKQAEEMVQKFNDKYINTSKPIEFVRPEFAQIRSSSNIPKNAIVAVERYLEGEFVKFSNNIGYVRPGAEITPAAFSHFTYDVTNGKILVCDLQGVNNGTRYTFTDPAIHSAGTEMYLYGPSDLGKIGIVKFFQSHKCNVLCEGLKKPYCTTNDWVELTEVMSKLPGGNSPSSTYTYQLSKLSDISKSKFEQILNNSELYAT